jgi:hypothetical protein
VTFASRLEEASKPEVVAKRKTADGKRVVLWSDGSISGRMGYQLKGVPMTKNPLTPRGVGWLFMSEVELYDSSELSKLYKAAKKVAKRGGNPGDVRREVGKLLKKGKAPKRPKIRWEVTQTDARGNPIERVWVPSRFQWPGIVVYDHVNRGSRHGGRYEVMTRVSGSRNTYRTTGMAFGKLADVFKYLDSVRVEYKG